jgi:hypothetical protein
MNDPDRYDLHNELSPLLLNMEVLINLCLDNDADCSDRLCVLHGLLKSAAGQLHERLDTLCHGSMKEPPPCPP